MFAGLIAICGGILAASSLIIAKKPNAKELIDKLTPYQGWIGIVMFFWGVWETIDVLTHVNLIAHFPLRWTFWAGQAVSDLLVGFLLGFGLITKYALGKNPAAERRGQMIRQKFAGYQGKLGLFAIAMGVLYIVWLYV